jgi:putative NIF3 family GTP cyclohydrolase 1 type 2
VQYAHPGRSNDTVSTVALCAGSGASVFKALSRDVDVLFTGELSHHEVLAAVEKGQHVILCGHTNTERGFLNTLQRALQRKLDENTLPEDIEVIISKQDQDPLQIV